MGVVVVNSLMNSNRSGRQNHLSHDQSTVYDNLTQFSPDTNDMQYSPYLDAFHVARRLLTAAAILIIVTVVLPAKKKRNETETDSRA